MSKNKKGKEEHLPISENFILKASKKELIDFIIHNFSLPEIHNCIYKIHDKKQQQQYDEGYEETKEELETIYEESEEIEKEIESETEEIEKGLETILEEMEGGEEGLTTTDQEETKTQRRKCKKDQINNVLTNRCINLKSPLTRNLYLSRLEKGDDDFLRDWDNENKQKLLDYYNKQIKKSSKKQQVTDKRKCKKDQINNVLTNRCINLKSPITRNLYFSRLERGDIDFFKDWDNENKQKLLDYYNKHIKKSSKKHSSSSESKKISSQKKYSNAKFIKIFETDNDDQLEYDIVNKMFYINPRIDDFSPNDINRFFNGMTKNEVIEFNKAIKEFGKRHKGKKTFRKIKEVEYKKNSLKIFKEYGIL